MTASKWAKFIAKYFHLGHLQPAPAALGMLLAGMASIPAHAELLQSVELFSGPKCHYSERVARVPAGNPAVLRLIHVEERAGTARHGELVRVPVFLLAGECASIQQLSIVPDEGATAGQPVLVQADDVRLGPDGGVSRAHLWFTTDLDAGQRKRFRLVRNSTPGPPRPAAAMHATQTAGGGLEITTEAGALAFDRRGALVSVSSATDVWRFGPQGASPNVGVAFPASDGLPARNVTLGRTSSNTDVRWFPGPLFTKVSVRMVEADGVALEQDFRIPRDGREVVVTTAVFTGSVPGGMLKQHRLLEASAGEASATQHFSVRAVPAGIREALRAEHAYHVTALIPPRGTAALLAIPLVLGGTNGIWSVDPNGRVALEGHQGLQEGNEGGQRTRFAYWTETRLVPVAGTSDRELWEAYRHHVQPLVAVVEEPAVVLPQLHDALRDLIEEMKPIGWRQEAGRAQVLGDTDRATGLLLRVARAKGGDLESLLRGARNAEAKLTHRGERILREDEKGRAYGGLDPYHVTYTQSAAAALAVLAAAPASVSAANLAMARGVQQFGGRVDDLGFPYVDCFNRALNMQLGPVLFGLTAGAEAGDDALVRFYRDVAASPLVKAVVGRGQRPYTGGPTTSAEPTDYLYQSICDFWLRAAELLGNENLELHPLAYSRYTDCIDVLADRYHGFSPKPKEGLAGEVRANFFRGQAHTHRWLGWSCSPYIRLLEDPREHSAIGLTEAVRQARSMKGQWKNWPDLTFYVLADLLVTHGLNHYTPPTLPTAPTQLAVTRAGNAAELSWQPVANAAGYRVYRTETPGGPYRWLNSPYVKAPPPLLVTPRFTDSSSTIGCEYVVTSVNADGRESGWTDLKPATVKRP